MMPRLIFIVIMIDSGDEYKNIETSGRVWAEGAVGSDPDDSVLIATDPALD